MKEKISPTFTAVYDFMTYAVGGGGGDELLMNATFYLDLYKKIILTLVFSSPSVWEKPWIFNVGQWGGDSLRGLLTNRNNQHSRCEHLNSTG